MNKSIQRGRAVMRRNGPVSGSSDMGDELMGKQGHMLNDVPTTETSHTPVVDGVESDIDVE